MSERFRPGHQSFFRWEAPRHNPGIPDPDAVRDKFNGVPRGSVLETRLPGERLPDTERNELLAFVCNSEAKLATLGAQILYPQTRGTSEMRTLMNGLQETPLGWHFRSGSVPFEYNNKSFFPIDLVTEAEVPGRGESLGFRITQKGKNVLPLIGHLLAYSEARPTVSLEKWLGRTALNAGPQQEEVTEGSDNDLALKKRPPVTRFTLFQTFAVTRDTIREIDLLRALGQTHQITDHLRNLHRLGIIKYESVEPDDDSYITYVVLPEARAAMEAPLKTKQRMLDRRTAFIASHLMGEFTVNHVLAIMHALFPHGTQRGASLASIRAFVIQQLEYMSREGYLGKSLLESAKKSDIDVNTTEKENVQELVRIIDSFQEGKREFLEEGAQLAKAILSSPSRMSSLMRKAREHSSIVSAVGPEVLTAEVKRIVDSHTGTLTIGQIEKQMERTISVSYVAKLVSQLAQQGGIRRVSNGRYCSNIALETTQGNRLGGAAGELALVEKVLAPYSERMLQLQTELQRYDIGAPERTQIIRDIAGINILPEYQVLSQRQDDLREQLESGEPLSRNQLLQKQVLAFFNLGVTDLKEIVEWIDVHPSSFTSFMKVPQELIDMPKKEPRSDRTIRLRHERILELLYDDSGTQVRTFDEVVEALRDEYPGLTHRVINNAIKRSRGIFRSDRLQPSQSTGEHVVYNASENG